MSVSPRSQERIYKQIGGRIMPTKTDRLQIRVSPEMKKSLQELAATENRTVSNYVEWLIMREIELHKAAQR